MDNKDKTLWTIGDIAKDYGCLTHKVIYAIEKSKVMFSELVGGNRAYTTVQKDIIEQTIRDIEAANVDN